MTKISPILVTIIEPNFVFFCHQFWWKFWWFEEIGEFLSDENITNSGDNNSFRFCFFCHQCQSMFIRRQQPKGFSKRQRLLTEPPCKYMQTICIQLHLCPSTRSFPCINHGSCQAWWSHARCQWSTYRPDGPSKPGSHKPHHQWHQPAYQARCTAQPPLFQKQQWLRVEIGHKS